MMKRIPTMLLILMSSFLLSSCGLFKDDCDCPNVGYKDDVKEHKEDMRVAQEENDKASL